MSRHDLKDEAQTKENPAAPPANCGKKVSRLPDPDQRVGRGARSAEACSEATALPALEQNGEDENYTVDDEQSEKKVVKH